MIRRRPFSKSANRGRDLCLRRPKGLLLEHVRTQGKTSTEANGGAVGGKQKSPIIVEQSRPFSASVLFPSFISWSTIGGVVGGGVCRCRSSRIDLQSVVKSGAGDQRINIGAYHTHQHEPSKQSAGPSNSRQGYPTCPLAATFHSPHAQSSNSLTFTNNTRATTTSMDHEEWNYNNATGFNENFYHPK